MSCNRGARQVAFHSQLSPILEILVRTAVTEINKLVDDGTAVLRLEMSQSHREIETLKKKVQLLEHELRATRRSTLSRGPRQPVTVPILDELRLNTKDGRGFGQDWSCTMIQDGESADVGVDAPVHSGIMQNQYASTKKVRTDPVRIKEERLDDGMSYTVQKTAPTTEEVAAQSTSVEDGQKTDTTPIEGREQLREQHRCGHGYEELSGLEFVVKAEQEEEHVAQRLNQTGYEHSTGRLNTLASECVVYERDNQLWTSFTQGNSDIEGDDPVCSNATEQCSQSLSVHSPIHHTPAQMEGSGNLLSSFRASYAEQFDKMEEMPSVCSEELGSEAIHTQQGLYRERLVHTVERENQTLLPQQQQHGPSVKRRRGNESPAQPHSGSQYETSYASSPGAVNSGRNARTDKRTGFGKKLFICTFCGKSFDRCSYLISHNRIHTGEKPYRCAQCGQCFTLKGNLVKHERVHSGYKPFGCAQCGKRFARGTNLRAHQRTHTGERPYHCSQCGKSFSHQRNLVVHERIHTAVKP